MTKHFFTFLFLLSFLALTAQNKKNYKIEIKIKGIEDSVLYLANYYGDKTFLVDTATLKGKNNYLFEGKKWLDGGIYIVVGEKKNTVFEFLISDSQHLKFDSDIDNLIEEMKVKGSNENALFFDYLAYSNIQFKKLKSFQQQINLNPNSDSIPLLNKNIEELNSDIVDYKEAIIEAYPDAFISHFFLAMKSPKTENLSNTSKQDSIQAFRNYKKHYWDYMNFDDERLIRTPVFHNKLDYYFTAIANSKLDSLINEIDAFLNRIDEKSELYKHSLWHLTLKFDQTNKMGYDAILVHFAENYYANGKASWLNNEVVKNILDEAKKRSNSLIGKKGPNLVMQNINSTPISMYSIDKKYTILYFWDPKCNHCKEETPKLREFYKQNAKRLNLEVFAVCADTNMQEMKAYIVENKLDWINVNGPRSYTQNFHELYNVYSTPFIFVLDKNKTIIAKQIKSGQVLDFITDYENIKQTEK
jgi:peroxiredoxin